MGQISISSARGWRLECCDTAGSEGTVHETACARAAVPCRPGLSFYEMRRPCLKF